MGEETLLAVYLPLYGTLRFYPSEIKAAENNIQTLLCVRDFQGKRIYTEQGAKLLASSHRGPLFVRHMKEAVGIKEKLKKRGRPPKDK